MSRLQRNIEDAINDQITSELSSGHLYLSMAGYFEATNLGGFAHWMKAQSQEESKHAIKLFDFVTAREGTIRLKGIPQPQAEFPSALGAMQYALSHEEGVTSQINKLYELAVKERDYPLQVLLHWFIEEQVEEERTVIEIVERLTLIGKDTASLLILDQQVGSRGNSE